jgi:hypothetical protein
MKCFKGFDKDLKCRGFQYEIGKEYEEETASLCNKGFHACEHPLDVFSYYPPSEGNRFCEVELETTGEKSSDDTKVCGTKIKIGAEIGFKGLIKAAFEYTKERCTNNKSGADFSALTGGDWSALTGGYRSALTGGDWSALTGGDWSALTGGNSSALTGGDSSALTGGDWSALTGGYRSALTGGDRSVVYGGEDAKVRAGKGSVLALQYWKNYEFKGIKFKEVDGVKIKENTYYKLDKMGRFVEVKD